MGQTQPQHLELLQQAAVQVYTGLALLQEHQAEAAKQTETALAVAAQNGAPAAAAAAAGVPWSPAADQNASWLPGAASPAGTGPCDQQPGSSSPGQTAATAAGHTHQVQQQQLLQGHITESCSSIVWQHDVSALKQSLLANAAYIELLMSNPDQALAAAQALLACSGMSPQQHYLGSCYAAEALYLLGRVDEAAEQLQTHMALFVSASSTAGGATAALASTVAAATDGVSTVSDDDGSCSGSRGTRGKHPGPGSPLGLRQQAAVLSNMSVLLATQRDWQSSQQHAASAVARDSGNMAAEAMLQLSSGASSSVLYSWAGACWSCSSATR